MLKKRYECPCFRILVIGRANAGKTTILEKVCGVAQGTKPVIRDEHGNELKANINPKLEPEDQPLPEPTLKLKRRPLFKLRSSLKKLFNKKSMSPAPSTASPASSVTHLTPSMEVSCMVVKHMELYLFAYNQF
jgi:hypothetical protein